MTQFPKTSSRVVRLLRLIVLLQSGEECTAASLQEALGVSRRTLFRDLGALEEAGCSTQYQRGIGYTINGGLMASFETFTTKELLGLIMLGKFARGHAEQPMINHGLAAIYRSVSAAPTELREACTDLMSHISIQKRDGAISRSVQQHFMKLIRFIDERSVCCVEVTNRDEMGMDSICFVPRTLILEDQGWKAVGESVLHDDLVEINLADITRIEQTQF
jgi:predicted DNA-binding transcriptional regulator YafY